MKPNPLQIPTPRFRPPGCRHKGPCMCMDRLMDKAFKDGLESILKPKPWPKGAGTTVRAVR